MERLTIFTAAELARAAARAAEAELPGSRRDHRRRNLGGRPRRPLGRRSDRLRLDASLPPTTCCPASSPMMQMHPGRCAFPDGTKLVTVHDPIRPGTRPAADGAHARRTHRCRRASIELNAGRRDGHAQGPSTPATGRSRSAVALPFLRDQQGAGVRPQPPPSACGSTFPPARRCGSSPAQRKEVTLVTFGGAGEIDGPQQPDRRIAARDRRSRTRRSRRARERGFKGA